jgi:hypothetical protein
MTLDTRNTAADPWEGLYEEERTTIQKAEQALLTERQSFDRWLDIGRGLYTMQAAVMRLAHTNRPIGKAYNAAYKRIETPVPELMRIDAGTRSDAIWLHENHERVATWRLELSTKQRDQWNNPRTIRRQFEKMTRPAALVQGGPRTDKNAIIAAQEERIDELEQRKGKVPGDQFDPRKDPPRAIARVLIEEMTLPRAETLARELAQLPHFEVQNRVISKRCCIC